MKNFILIVFTLSIGSHLVAQQDNYEAKLDVLYAKAYQHLYKNNDSTSYYFNVILHIALEKEDWSNVFESLISENRNAGYYYDLKTLKKNLLFLDSLSTTKKSYLDSLPDGNFYLNSILYDKGNYHFKVNNFRDARKAFQTIISDIEKTPDELVHTDQIYLLSAAYSFMANMYQQEGKYKLAKQFYDKDIRYLEIKVPNDLEEINRRYSLLASLYNKENDFENSNRLYRKVIAQITTENIGNNSYISAYNNIAQNYILQKQIDSADYYLDLMSEFIKADSPFESSFHVVQAEKFQLENKYPEALVYLKKALTIELTKQNSGKNIKIAEIYKKIGMLNVKFDSLDKATIEFKKGIKILSHSTSKIDRFTLLDLIGKNAQTLIRQAHYETYSEALKSTQLGIRVLDSLKPSFINASDKLGLIENSFPLFESGIEATYQIFNSTAEDSLIDLAFDYAEKSKSVLLLEALLSAKAIQFANIPNDVLEIESQLKSEITYLEKQLNQSKEENNEKQDELFKLQEEHRQLINTIETKYKTYYDLKYNTKTLSLVETQNLLASDELLISYFYGNNAIYAIGVDKTSKQIERIPIDAFFEADIKDVHQMLGDSKSDISILATASHKLYEQLVAPFVTSKEKKKLVIIADGLLNYIPFGALNTQENNLTYLMEKHAVSYANSATLYAQLLDRKTKDGSLLAFAPSFSGEQIEINPNRDKLLPLPHNGKEVKQILTSFEGQAFVNENASLQNFTSELSNYRILHLATHAVFDDTSPEYSFLAFSQDTGEKENLLYVSDLYNLQINADLVTLSACETGIGELKRGEGFLSLARGFFYSGASSIVSTLWKVNDASTATLMKSFYENLSQGSNKDLALQKAQKSFLDTNRQNGLSHPYYWSGFVISGNTVQLTSPNYLVWLGIAVLLSLIAGFVFFRSKKG